MTSARPLRSAQTIFALASAAIVAAAIAVTHAHAFSRNADVAAWGVTFDLTLTIPIVYYLVVIRGGAARPITIAPLFAVCTALAAIVVPRGQQQFLHDLRFVGAPLDVVTVVLVVRRLLASRQSGDADVHTRIEHAAHAVFGHGIAAAFVATEVSTIYHALFCWRKTMVVPAGSKAVTVHKRSDWRTIVVCIIVLVAAESLGAHLLVQQWSRAAAWIVTALDTYGMVWLIGDYHAIRLRPTLVDAGAVHFRHGLRWSVTVERANIASVERLAAGSKWKRKKTLKLALLDEPKYLIRLREPAVVTRLGGIRAEIDAIAILPDDEADFENALGMA